ncbi:MAG: AhpC/TSA family protein [Bacteroidaceae bacterium]|nr:AhpC/TSA family protein [Bacteroidaceae bacterium]
MRNKIFSIIALAACMAVSAQETCIINGTIADNDTKVKKVSLTRTDELGNQITVATAKVKRGKYTLTHELAQDAPALQYTLTGFGEAGSIALFVEPGEVAVNTALASSPEQSTVSGTPTNDTYAQYQAILAEAEREVADKVAALEQQHGQAWTASPEGKSDINRLKAQVAIKTESQVIRFLIEHNASPMMPLVTEHTLLPKLTDVYAGQMLNAVSTTLHTHPYYLSLRNSVLSASMKVGNEVPDITLPLLTGDSKRLSDYRGRYVVLHFWKSDCESSAASLDELMRLHEVIKEHQDQFVIISVALDTDKSAWQAAVESKGISHESWLHACDGAGAASPAAKLFGVDNTPKIIVVEPEGLAVSLNMDIDDVVMRTEQILSGDLYYLDQQE